MRHQAIVIATYMASSKDDQPDSREHCVTSAVTGGSSVATVKSQPIPRSRSAKDSRVLVYLPIEDSLKEASPERSGWPILVHIQARIARGKLLIYGDPCLLKVLRQVV
jgi:hypothetical protein